MRADTCKDLTHRGHEAKAEENLRKKSALTAEARRARRKRGETLLRLARGQDDDAFCIVGKAQSRGGIACVTIAKSTATCVAVPRRGGGQCTSRDFRDTRTAASRATNIALSAVMVSVNV